MAALLVARAAHADVARVGGGPDALPAVYEVPVAAPTPLGFAARLGLNYGLTESVLNADDTHHRAQLDAAGSLTPLPWFAASLRLLTRYDGHVGAAKATDDGVITEAHAGARAAVDINSTLRSGLDLSLWFPGADTAGHSARALSGDLQWMLTYLPGRSPFTVGLAAGLRVDRTKYSGGDPSMYTAADRLALGVSDSMYAARIGLALSYRIGTFDLLAEWAWKLYFDYAAESPMWLRAGVRYRVSRLWQLEAMLGVSPSPRPSLAADAPATLIEPRFSAGFAAALAFPWETSASALERQEPELEAEPAAVQLPAAVRGKVQTSGATGIAGAKVELRRGTEQRQVVSDAAGDFTIDELAAGAYQLSVSASGWSAHEGTLELRAGANPALEITLKRELPQAQIRGTVRSFDGAPLKASISIPALHVEQSSRDDGTFEVDVAPGEYALTVKARGFRSQTRRARVEQNGVAILIVELQPDRR
jgi:hypothetical protein